MVNAAAPSAAARMPQESGQTTDGDQTTDAATVTPSQPTRTNTAPAMVSRSTT